MLVDHLGPGLDRDLIDTARAVGCATIVVLEGAPHRDWVALGASAVLPAPVHRDALVAVLRECASPVSRLAGSGADLADIRPLPSWEGRLVAVAGHGGSGTSTVAAALAQGLAADPAHGGRVVLLDGALDADQAILHDTGDVIPGLQELVDAHRSGTLDRDQTRALTWHCAEQGYDLVLGLRRHRDWTVLQPRAVEAAVGSLRRAYSVVVADVDADVEGEGLTGSVDVEERNLLARHLHEVRGRRPGHVRRPRSPACTGWCGPSVPSPSTGSIRPGCCRSSTARRSRHGPGPSLTRALAELLDPVTSAAMSSPLHLPFRKEIDLVHRDAAPLPRALVEPSTAAVTALLEHLAPNDRHGALAPMAVPIGATRSAGGAR